MILAVVAAVLAAGSTGVWYLTAPTPDLPLITVYKSPDCACCRAWIQHLRNHGFRVQVGPEAESELVRARYGVPPSLHACHTAVVNGLLIEGHVPADDIHRALAQPDGGNDNRPSGLIVPGMPSGSPGMESAHPQGYTVLALERSGGTRPFATH